MHQQNLSPLLGGRAGKKDDNFCLKEKQKKQTRYKQGAGKKKSIKKQNKKLSMQTSSGIYICIYTYIDVYICI